MKKHVMLALVLALTATGAFALNIGGGVLFDNRAYIMPNDYSTKDFGLYGFVGWKYMDIDVGVTYRHWEISRFSNEAAEDIFLGQVGLDFKLPINITYFFRVYPTIGANVGLSTNFEYLDLGVHAGAGMDFLLFGDMYVRGVFLYNLNFEPEFSSFLFKLGVGWLL